MRMNKFLTISLLMEGSERIRMAREKKLENPVTLFAAIEKDQHDALRFIAFKERRSIADIAREAIENYIREKSEKYTIVSVS